MPSDRGSERDDPSSKPLAPVLEGFGVPSEQRAAAVAEYGEKFDAIDLDAIDAEEDPILQAKRSADTRTGGSVDRPNLEPVGDDAHPPQNRRMPTQPPSALSLDLDEQALRPGTAEFLRDRKAKLEGNPSTQAKASGGPTPPLLGSRQSPAPLRRRLFSSDRITNLLAGLAIGLLLTIYPAKKFARAYEVREIEPMLEDLQGAIEHPLGVEAGLVKRPEAIAAEIHDGRSKVRQRYMAIWLLAGLPIGLGLSLIPRPGD